MQRRREDNGNSWDGYDGGKYVYDAARERSFQARVWIVLACAMGAVLAYLLVDHAKELYWMWNGNVVEAFWDGKSRVARYKDEEGKWHMWDLSAYYPKEENGRVLLYYAEDPDEAKPVESTGSRVFYYVFFGAPFGVCVHRIRKIRRSYRSNPPAPPRSAPGELGG